MSSAAVRFEKVSFSYWSPAWNFLRHHGRSGWNPLSDSPPHKGGGTDAPISFPSTALSTQSSLKNSHEQFCTVGIGKLRPKVAELVMRLLSGSC